MEENLTTKIMDYFDKNNFEEIKKIFNKNGDFIINLERIYFSFNVIDSHKAINLFKIILPSISKNKKHYKNLDYYLGNYLKDACFYGNIDVVKYLLTNEYIKADINIGADKALRWAAQNGYQNIVEFLLTDDSLEKKANMESGKYKSFRVAAKYGHFDIVKKIISINPDIEKRRDILYMAAIESFNANENEITMFLIKKYQIKFDEIMLKILKKYKLKNENEIKVILNFNDLSKKIIINDFDNKNNLNKNKI